MPCSLHKVRVALWMLTILAYSATYSLINLSGFPVDYSSFAPLVAGMGLGAVFISAYCSARDMPRLRSIGECAFLGVLLTVPVVISTYLAAWIAMPLADARLSRMDSALGFSWFGFIHFVDSVPWLAFTLGIAYQSFAFQLLGLPILLAAIGRAERAYAMVVSYALICFVSSIISTWFPALGTYVTYGVHQRDLHNIDAHFAFFFLDQFNAVRNAPRFLFTFSQAAGIVTFPSVHAGVAAVCGWAVWKVPVIRYPIVLLNVFMAAAAISNANHYLVDVIAGGLIAALCISSVKVLVREAAPTVKGYELSHAE
ncbi:PAP2 superfamily protein [Rhizobium sp. BK376]|nr:PAP2 superfamily protein [Rhizobium sp. BK376]